MSDREALIADARTAYGRNDWTGARSRLLDADAHERLEAEDLERLAWSCRWVSDEAGFLNALERAEVAFSAAGARAAAARTDHSTAHLEGVPAGPPTADFGSADEASHSGGGFARFPDPWRATPPTEDAGSDPDNHH